MKTVLRVAKLKTPGNIGGLNAHNTRTMDVPNADQDLYKYNHRLVGSANLNKDVQDRLNSAGITKVRSNGVRAIEHIISASPEFFGKEKRGEGAEATLLLRDPQESKEFFETAKKWLQEHYGRENLVNFTVHYDEKTPHAHAIVVPITSEGKLAARQLIGKREQLSAMQTGFAKAVEHLGIDRGREGSKARHQTLKEFYSKVEEADEYFKGMEKIESKDLDKSFTVKAFQVPEREKLSFGRNKLTDEEYGEVVKKEVSKYVDHVVGKAEEIFQAKADEMGHFTTKLAQIDIEAKKEKRTANALRKEIKELKEEHKQEVKEIKEDHRDGISVLEQRHQNELARKDAEIQREKAAKEQAERNYNSLKTQYEGYVAKAEKVIADLKTKALKYLTALMKRIDVEGKLMRKAQVNNIDSKGVRSALAGHDDRAKDVGTWAKDMNISQGQGRSR